MEKSDLLQQLRIDRNEPAPRVRGAGAWVAGVLVALLLAGLAVGGWW